MKKISLKDAMAKSGYTEQEYIDYTDQTGFGYCGACEFYEISTGCTHHPNVNENMRVDLKTHKIMELNEFCDKYFD